MTGVQKVIKYAAMCFAIFLAVTIISAILSVVLGFAGILNFNSETMNYSESFEYISDFDVKVNVAKLEIIESNEFKVEALNVSESFTCENKNSKLVINEESSSFNFFGLFKRDNVEMKIYIPENYIFEFVKLDTGVGEVEIQKLNSKEIDFNIGVGEFTCYNLTSNKTKISSGVGEINILDANIKDVDLETGIGEANISGRILGDSKIECGIGAVNLDLIGRKSDYDIDTESGIGKITINDNSTDETISTPNNKLDIESGIGEVIVNFK